MSGEVASSSVGKDAKKEKPPDRSRRKRWEVDELEDPGKRSRMSAYELQKKRLERLMAQPVREMKTVTNILCRSETCSMVLKCNFLKDKPAEVPDKASEWKPKDPPDFVRFYMGKGIKYITQCTFRGYCQLHETLIVQDLVLGLEVKCSTCTVTCDGTR